jgi:hypothetical protein
LTVALRKCFAAAAVAAVFAAAPASAASSPGDTKRGTTVTIAGTITPDTRAQFMRLLDKRTKTVVVNSGGGDSMAAMEIGREIRKRNLQVTVQRACLAACAHFIFLAARERRVEPLSLVIFQATASSLAKLIATAPARERRAAEAALLTRKTAEEQFMRELGIPQAILTEPQLQLQTGCYRFVGDRSGDIEMSRAFVGWVPTKAYLAQRSIRVSGYWPATPDDFLRAHANVFRNGKAQIQFGGAPLSAGEIETRYKAIKLCA